MLLKNGTTNKLIKAGIIHSFILLFINTPPQAAISECGE